MQPEIQALQETREEAGAGTSPQAHTLVLPTEGAAGTIASPAERVDLAAREAAGAQPSPILLSPAPWFHLDRAAWLTPEILLLAGSASDPDTETFSASVCPAGTGEATELECLPLAAQAAGAPQVQAERFFLFRFDTPCEPAVPGKLLLRSGKRATTLEPKAIHRETVDLQKLLLDRLAGLSAGVRMAILNFCAATAGAADTHSARRRHNLLLLREALRARLPCSLIAENEPHCLNIELLLRADDRRFYVKGFLRDRDRSITRLLALSPEGAASEIFEELFRHRRPDLEKLFGPPAANTPAPGFVASFALKSPSHEAHGWTFQAFGNHGLAFEANAPEAVSDLLSVRDKLLADLALAPPSSDELLRRHLHPALAVIQERRARLAAVECTHQFGSPPSAPPVSIVVPLDQRIELLEHQLAQFVHDPELRAADLIYVLDSPEKAPEALELARGLSELYWVPFRVAVIRESAGLASAANLGASLAAGRLLLLLNPDVFPEKPGWLGRMVSFYNSRPGIGAVGAKLLYEDESLQHAGLFFYRPAPGACWQNEHFFKGLHRSLPAANQARQVPALSAACLLVSRELFHQAGGLSAGYLDNEYADSDLCLRLAQAGCENWYLPEAELYHLEEPAPSGELRPLSARYNAWLHTHLWNERIETLTKERKFNYAKT